MFKFFDDNMNQGLGLLPIEAVRSFKIKLDLDYFFLVKLRFITLFVFWIVFSQIKFLRFFFRRGVTLKKRVNRDL
jgi:hypothetical protein